MTKQLLVCVLLTGYAGARPVAFRRFEKAIERLDTKRIEVLLKKNERNNPSDAQRKELFADLHDATADRVDALEERVVFYRHIMDAARTVLGTLSSFAGIGFIVASLGTSVRTRGRLLGQRIGGGTLLALGSYLFYKGIRCSSQQSWLARMKKLEEQFGAQYDELDQEDDL